MTDPKHIFWDSCIFIRYLTEESNEYLDDIARFITDASKGERKIFFSTISFTEIRPRHFKRRSGMSILQFFSEWKSAFTPIEPNPNILADAGEIRDAEPTNPSTKTGESNRIISTPDAIQLMTCVFVRDVLGFDDIIFHTFDRGRHTIAGEKCVPIIGFERWFPEGSRHGHVAKVCSLERMLPEHPHPNLMSGLRHE